MWPKRFEFVYFLVLLSSVLPGSEMCLSAEVGEVVALGVELRARVIAPGEPVRIVVHSPVQLETLAGEFRGHGVSLEAVEGPGDRQTWVGWAMVGLLEEEGVDLLELVGRCVDGRQALASVVVKVGHKDFPSEHLSVEPKYVAPPKAVQRRIKREKARLAEIYALRTPQPFPAKPFLRPVPGEKTSPFGTRRYFNGKARAPHSGLDLRAATGEEVHASGPGRVVLAANLYYSGNLVIIDHGGGLFTLYAHLSRFGVGEGELVKAGQAIGLSGATGRVTGPHLHWGAKIGSRPFDPRALLDPSLFGGSSSAVDPEP